MDDLLTQQVVQMAKRCGDCKRLFDDVAGDYCYVRTAPARLICEDCKLRESVDTKHGSIAP